MSVELKKLAHRCERVVACGSINHEPPLIFMMGSVTSLLNNDSLSGAMQDKKLQGLLYQELRVIAHAKLNIDSENKELDTTSLVHEAYLKLNSNSTEKKWSNRRHFYATAALSMRHILVDNARRRLAEKRLPEDGLDLNNESYMQMEERCQNLVSLDEALEQLKSIDSGLVELVNLRYFVGLNMEEIAELKGVSKRTMDRQWLKVKAILMAWLK